MSFVYLIEWEWTAKRRDKLADVLIGTGHVIFGATVLKALLERFDPFVFLLGGAASLALWVLSLVTLEGKTV